MRQNNVHFINILNRFQTVSQTNEDIHFMNDFYLDHHQCITHYHIYSTQTLKPIPIKKIVYNKTPSKTFKFLTRYIHFETCPFHFKLSMLPFHLSGLRHKLMFKKYMLVELCASNYTTLYGIVSGIDGTFQNYKKKIQNHCFKYISIIHKLEQIHE
jgi:hypothetical protein